MKKSVFTRILALLLALAMIVGSAFYLVYIIGDAGSVAYAAESETEAYSKLADLEAVIKTIQANYKEDVDVSQLVEAAYEGVFDELDAWSEYYPTQEEEQAFVSSLENENYSGVGLTLQKNDDGSVRVAAVNPKGPAYSAGVKKNDAITKVDGVSVLNQTLDAVANKMRGKEGTSVKLTITRGSQSLEFTITRALLSTTTVDIEDLGNGISLIDISAFNLGTASDFADVYYTARDEGCDKFVIDLRDNTGGYMDEALNCAAYILKVGSKLCNYMKGTEVINTIEVVGTDLPYTNPKIVLLINEDTASASEAFAMALKGNKAATIVGVTSYGKGVAQQIFEGESGDYFKLSTMHFTGPNKEKIDGVGIKPDYVVYNNGGLSQDEVNDILNHTIPMTEGKKYTKLYSYGLNVLAAQQRLQAMGYDVKTTSILDEATMQALKMIQKDGGGTPYGGLDFFTIKALDAKFNAYIYGTEDMQLQKAVELLSK